MGRTATVTRGRVHRISTCLDFSRTSNYPLLFLREIFLLKSVLPFHAHNSNDVNVGFGLFDLAVNVTKAFTKKRSIFGKKYKFMSSRVD